MYTMYMNDSDAPDDDVSVAKARERFPAILEAAESGCETVITRRGKPVAVLGPLSLRRPTRHASLDSLAGTGAGLWGKASSHVAGLREEWE
jgi:prevent-host-death family protein